MKRDGFLEDVISGRDVNDRDRWLLRGQLLFQPNDDLSVRLIGDYSKRDEECCAAPYLPAARLSPPAGEQPVDHRGASMRALGAIISDDTVRARRRRSRRAAAIARDVKDCGLSGEVVYDFGGAELTSITAYRYNKYDPRHRTPTSTISTSCIRDDDGTAFNRFKTFTQECALQGEAFDGRLDWLVGGYYANEKLRLRRQPVLRRRLC